MSKPYTCQKCKEECKISYVDKAKKKWICEKCWKEESAEDGEIIEDDE